MRARLTLQIGDVDRGDRRRSSGRSAGGERSLSGDCRVFGWNRVWAFAWQQRSSPRLLAVFGMASAPSASAADPCGAGGNPVACENSKPGDDPSRVGHQGAGDSTIQGFATTTSVAPGQTVRFKIKAQTRFHRRRLPARLLPGSRRPAPGHPLDREQPGRPARVRHGPEHPELRLRHLVGHDPVGGPEQRRLGRLHRQAHHGQRLQPDPVRRARLTGPRTSSSRPRTRPGRPTTPTAAPDFYTAPDSLTGTQARAFKISYNRPYATRDRQQGRDYLFSNEYPTLRFLERNGIDVSYTTDVDVSAGTSVLTGHEAFLSVGHDEYWTKPERDAVEAARDAGVNLMFLSGNEAYWHARLEPSIDGSNTANRTLVCYKDSWEPAKIDPGEGSPTWRDASQAAPNGSRPENALTGTMYMSNFTDLAITVSAAQGRARLWRHTSLATMAPGTTATLAPHSIGYESDEDVDNGSARPVSCGCRRPPVRRRRRSSTRPGPRWQPARRRTASPSTARPAVRSSSAPARSTGAGVWTSGHDGDATNPADSRMQQATLNLLVRHGCAAGDPHGRARPAVSRHRHAGADGDHRHRRRRAPSSPTGRS